MSYKVTEAERKYVAAVDDTKLAIEREPAEGQTSKLFVHISDGDKLDLREELPSYKFAVDSDDDKASRLRLIDTTDEDHQIICEGATLNGKVQGLGWRYRIVFNKAKDDDKYVDSIKLVRENDGKTDELTFRNFNVLNVKSLTVDNDFTSRGSAAFKAGAIIDGNLEVNADEEGNGGSISAKELHSSKTVSTDINATNLAVAESLATSGLSTTGDVSISSGTVSIANSSVVADETTDIAVDHASIAKLSTSAVESAQIKNTGKITSASADIEAINVTALKALDVNTSALTSKDASISNATVETATVTSVSTGEISNSGKITTGSISADAATAATAAVGTLTVTDETTTNSTVESLTTSTAAVKKATIDTAAITDAKISNTETEELLVSDNATVANDLKVSGTTSINQISTLDGSKVFTYNEDNSILGSNDKLLVLKSSSDKSISEDSDNYGHIKAVVDNKECYLATVDDLERLNPLGVVDRSSNQTISGIKTFENQIIARGGVTFKDDEGHIKNVISHISNYNESKDVTNPKYVEAKAEYDAYEKQLVAKDDVYAKYTAAVDAKASYVDAKTAADKAHAAYEDAIKAEAVASSKKDSATAEYEAYQPEVEAAKAKLDAAAIPEETATAKANAQTAYDTAIESRDTELASKKWRVLSEEDASSFRRDVDSAEADTTDWTSIYDYTEASTYEEAANGVDALIAEIEKIISNNPVDATYTSKLTEARVRIENLKEDNLKAKGDLDKAVEDADTALEAANEAYDDAEKAYNEANASYKAAEAHSEALKSAADTAAEDYAAATALTAHKKADDEAAADATAKADAASKAADASFFAAEESYYSVYLNQQVQITELAKPAIPEVAISELAQSYKDNDIPPTILKYDPDHIFLGDSEDELQIKSKALADGDEHIQATIGGKAHLLANTDDILVGIYDGSKNTVITDVDHSTNADSKTVQINTVTERMEKGGTTDEDRFKPVTEAAATLKFGSRFQIVENEDSSTSIDIDLSDIAGGVVADVALEDNKLTVTKAYDVKTEYSFKGDVDVKVEGNDVTTTVPRFNDSITNKENKEEVVAAYEKLDFTEDNLKKLATASDVRLLHDDAIEQTDKLAKILQTRLPVAPHSQGNYNLTATVYENKDDTAEKHDVSVAYAWAASAQLPSTSLEPVTDPATGEAHYALDSDGNRLDPDFEYGLKLKYVDSTNANGETIKVPTFMWCKLAK